MRVHCEHLPFSREPNSIRALISTHSIGYNKKAKTKSQSSPERGIHNADGEWGS